VFWRYGFYGAAVAAGLVLRFGLALPGMVRRWFGRCGVAGAVLFATCNLCFTRAVQMTAAANVLVVISVGPMITALLARVFLKESIPWRTVTAIVVCFVAILVVFVGELEADSDEDAVVGLVLVGERLPACLPAWLAYLAARRGRAGPWRGR